MAIARVRLVGPRVRLARLVAVLGLLAGGAARAQEESSADTGELSPEDQALLDTAMKGEVIEVWAERPNKPFDRDTELRITGISA